MSINQLILRNLKKNIKNYYLYVFALIFSVALYFAFVTLQYDPAMDEAKGSIKGAAALKAGSILLVAIVSIFLLYANNIFIKQRSKEIGLFQLIGLTKNKIFRILSTENFIIYFSSIFLGIFVGFSLSKLAMMILIKITGVGEIATLTFSGKAFIQTLIVFIAVYFLIMLMNYLFIKRQSILSLFRVISSTEQKGKKISLFQILLGNLGILLIIAGYFVSSMLFDGDFTTINELFLAMAFILGSVILGTYLFYKGSVSFLFSIFRKMKNGYLNINEVLSLSSIMFRMKSNSLLLTIITTVSALAIGLLSLSYISYYSAEKTAHNNVAADFAFTIQKDAALFKESLVEQGIGYTEKEIDVLQVTTDLEPIMADKLDGLKIDTTNVPISVISDKEVKNLDVSADETIFTGYNDLLQKFMKLKESGSITFKSKSEIIKQSYLGLERDYHVSWYFTDGGLPVAIVDQSVFERLQNDLDPAIQKESSLYIGINIQEDSQKEKANESFKDFQFHKSTSHDSLIEMSMDQKLRMGIAMFIVGFLGLTFLITSGCILYFKQMGEGEEEKPSYTILRKLGFTKGDLVNGIRAKQLFNFGIPLVIGLLHSYFAVQSGWFLFGAEVWTPMILVMVLYTGLYSIFGILSVQYYKKVINEAL